MDPLQVVLDAQAPLHEALEPGDTPHDARLWATLGVVPEDMSSAPLAEPLPEGGAEVLSDGIDRAIFGALVTA